MTINTMELNKEELDFLDYWSRNRQKQKRVGRQFLLGIPLALLFVIPICINFFSGWYKRADMMEHTTDFNPGVLLAALLLIVGFIAIFSRRFQWEKNEQRYQELLLKQSKTAPEEKK